LIPLRVDGLIYPSSMVLDAARKTSVPVLARWLLGLGIADYLATGAVMRLQSLKCRGLGVRVVLLRE
jgi:hypothetical protein